MPPKKILIVDDEKNFLEIMSAKLKGAGFDVITADGAKEGIESAARLMPDLVLMDINMPGLTGTDAALAIKQDPRLKDIRVAFLSSLKKPFPAFDETKRQAVSKELGMEDFIEKTDDLDVIVQKVRAILAGK